MLSKLRPDEVLELKSALQTMEVHQHDKGAVLFHIHGEGLGGTILLPKPEVEKLKEFLENRQDFS